MKDTQKFLNSIARFRTIRRKPHKNLKGIYAVKNVLTNTALSAITDYYIRRYLSRVRKFDAAKNMLL